MASTGTDTASLVEIAVAAAPPLSMDVVDRLRALLGPLPDDLGASVTPLPLPIVDAAPRVRLDRAA